MATTCPACNKAGQTTGACQRCGCDLSRLHSILASAASRLNEARAALQDRDWLGALLRAEQSWRLRQTVEAARLAFLAAAARGETARALCWHERAASGG